MYEQYYGLGAVALHARARPALPVSQRIARRRHPRAARRRCAARKASSCSPATSAPARRRSAARSLEQLDRDDVHVAGARSRSCRSKSCCARSCSTSASSSRDAMRSGRLAAASRHELISTLHEFLLSLVPHQRQRRADHRRGAAPVARGARTDPHHRQPRDQRVELLQIVLVGQPNLLDTLAAAEHAPARRSASRCARR